MLLTVDISEGSELLTRLATIEDLVDGLFDTWHAFSEVCEDHLGSARISRRPNEPSLYY